MIVKKTCRKRLTALIRTAKRYIHASQAIAPAGLKEKKRHQTPKEEEEGMVRGSTNKVVEALRFSGRRSATS